MIILHFASKNEWDEESEKGTYGSRIIKENNFIPCYKFSDISSININISTLKDYVILCIDESKVSAKINYEKLENSNIETPNIYGVIEKDAVVHVLPYTFNSEDKFVVTKELLDFNIINDVCEKLNIRYKSHQYFHDGTSSRIILLNDQYIVKQSNSNMLKAEVTFATFYTAIPNLQKIAYYDKDYKFVVYEFIPGDVMHVVTDFNDLASGIKKIVTSYKPYNEDGFGYIENTFQSWTEFLKAEVNEAVLSLPDLKTLLPTVTEAIEELDKYQFEKKLIHGDFGTHNFIKQNDRFIAAIDPIPMIGDPTYDLLFALVSNIDLIPYLSIDYLTEYTGEVKGKVISLLKVVLFSRICRCAKYNKDWIEPYMDFWNNLFN